jgi:sarcosine oxidase delta subunit
MFSSIYHECPHCGVEIEIEFEVNETDPELPANCPFCDKALEAAPGLIGDAMGALTDQATDHAKGSE